MYQRSVISVIVLIVLSLNHTVGADITGKVSNQSAAPIVGATVSLVGKGVTATTTADGTYKLAVTVGAKAVPALQVKSSGITLQKGFLNFSLADAAPVKYEMFDIAGNLLKKEVLPNARRGVYRFNIAEKSRTAALLIIRASIGNAEVVYHYVPVNSNRYTTLSLSEPYTPLAGGVAKTAAVADSVKVTADGYKAQAIAVTSYEQLLDITMEVAASAFAITSTKFVEGDMMPDEYTCEGKSLGGGIAPPIEWSGIPAGTKSLALFFKDLTAAAGAQPSMGYHWGMWNIPITVTGMPEGLAGDAKPAAMGGAEQLGAVSKAFFGPCPDYSKKGGIKDTYAFVLYAFDMEKVTPPTVLMQMDKYFEEKAIAKTSLSVWSDAQPK